MRFQIIRILEKLIRDPSLFADVPPKNTNQSASKSQGGKTRTRKLRTPSGRLLDSVDSEERNSPELPALNIPFASQTAEPEIENPASQEPSDTVSQRKAVETSAFQFLCEQ